MGSRRWPSCFSTLIWSLSNRQRSQMLFFANIQVTFPPFSSWDDCVLENRKRRRKKQLVHGQLKKFLSSGAFVECAKDVVSFLVPSKANPRGSQVMEFSCNGSDPSATTAVAAVTASVFPIGKTSGSSCAKSKPGPRDRGSGSIGRSTDSKQLPRLAKRTLTPNPLFGGIDQVGCSVAECFLTMPGTGLLEWRG